MVVPQLLKSSLAPANCRWCDGPDNTGLPGTGSRGSLDGVDAFFHDALTGSILSREAADTVSDLWTYGAVTIGSLTSAAFATGPHASQGAGARAIAIVVESTAVSAALVQGLKFTTGRKRPFVRYGHGEVGGRYNVDDRETNLGFPSGHAALAASVSVSAAMLSSLQESSAAPWLWGGAAFATVSSAALRVIAEKHYFTDVLAGAAIGAACGVFVPLLHRRGSLLAESGTASLTVAPTAVMVAGTF